VGNGWTPAGVSLGGWQQNTLPTFDVVPFLLYTIHKFLTQGEQVKEWPRPNQAVQVAAYLEPAFEAICQFLFWFELF